MTFFSSPASLSCEHEIDRTTKKMHYLAIFLRTDLQMCIFFCIFVAKIYLTL